jgi:hypothetical protein
LSKKAQAVLQTAQSEAEFEQRVKKLIKELSFLFKQTKIPHNIVVTFFNDFVFEDISADHKNIVLGYHKDEDIQKGNFLHELGHIKLEHELNLEVLEKLTDNGKKLDKERQSLLMNYKGEREFQADLYMARKNFDNIHFTKKGLENLQETCKVLGVEKCPPPYQRLNKINITLKLMEEEKRLLGPEWYRREYDRAFYKEHSAQNNNL